ncbi:MAG: N-glycosylase/DNA lyase [Candidatus Pacearchaeota archaeon]
MDELINEIKKLQNSEIKSIIDERMQEFSYLGKKPNKEIFKELCFCLMTANYSALGSIKIQKEVGDGFIDMDKNSLAIRLKSLGHRFPNARAEFIVNARNIIFNIKEKLNELKTDFEKREWLVRNIKGLGMKEASHFLRNIGHKNVAVIDFHIIDLLVKHRIIERPKTLTAKKYLEIEKNLNKLSEIVGISLGELDLYLWYLETGKVLK